ncbi:MAG: hypothetical protein ACE5EA_11525, partial [Nitrospirota bacterium]
MKTKINIIVLSILLFMGVNSSVFAVSLTSITLDPEDSTGTTTNAPGAWSTNTGDPLSQVGVFSDGVFLNQEADLGNLGEISIPLKPGINTFTLFGNGIFPGNAFYGAVLFFDGVPTPPQAAVYNENGTLGSFSIQPADTTIIGSANGGIFLDKAPGTSVYIAPDGTKVEVLGYVINSMSSNTDEISFGQIGPDGTMDTTAQLILRVTPPQNISGCIELKGTPIIGSKVFLRQKDEPTQKVFTDPDGCYRFENAVSGKKFGVIIKGPIVP